MNVWRMSSAGHCPKQLFCERTGVPGEPRPDWLDSAAEEGYLHERAVKEKLKADGYVLTDCEICPECARLGLDRRGVHVELDGGDVMLVGHLDGLISKYNPVKQCNEDDLLEVKSMSFFEFNRWKKGGFENFPEYRSQLALYFAATGKERALYIVKDRNNGYMDKNIVLASEFHGVADSIIDTISAIQKAIDCNEMPTGIYDPDEFRCKRCSWKALCHLEPVKLDTEVEEDLDEAQEQFRKGLQMRNLGDEMIESAQAKFLRQSQAGGKRRWFYKGLRVNWVTIAPTVYYPKRKLLETFTEEQLKPAAWTKKGSDFVKLEEVE